MSGAIREQNSIRGSWIPVLGNSARGVGLGAAVGVDLPPQAPEANSVISSGLIRALADTPPTLTAFIPITLGGVPYRGRAVGNLQMTLPPSPSPIVMNHL